jgi:Ni/Fe-hydrogenase subunit HybB-like protein
VASVVRVIPLHDRTVTFLGRSVPLDPRVLVAAAVADVRAMPRLLKAWLAFLIGVLAIGAVAAVIALPPGWEVFGTTPTVEWGVLIIGYVGFAIMTSGLCLASSLGTVFGVDRFRPLEKRHAILAVLCLTSAFGIIALDLHWPIRLVFGAILAPSPSSPMWWMGVCYGGYLGLLLVEVWSMFSDHPRLHQWACTLAAGMAIVAPTTLGAVFGVLVARPSWNGPFTPLLMVASAFVAGVSLLGIVLAIVVRLRRSGFERAERLAVPGLRWLLVIGLVVIAILLVRSVVAGLDGDVRGLRETTEAVLFGPLAIPFWVLRVGVGLALPMLLMIVPVTRTPTGLLLASAGALTGVFTDRWLFVLAGQIVPVTASAGVVSSPYASYGPSPVEIAIVLGAGAFVALGYTLAERYLDLSESELHFGFPLVSAARRVRDRGVRLYGSAVAQRERRAAEPRPGDDVQLAAPVLREAPATEVPVSEGLISRDAGGPVPNVDADPVPNVDAQPATAVGIPLTDAEAAPVADTIATPVGDEAPAPSVDPEPRPAPAQGPVE